MLFLVREMESAGARQALTFAGRQPVAPQKSGGGDGVSRRGGRGGRVSTSTTTASARGTAPVWARASPHAFLYSRSSLRSGSSSFIPLGVQPRAQGALPGHGRRLASHLDGSAGADQLHNPGGADGP